MAIPRYDEQASQYIGMVRFDPAQPQQLDLTTQREQLRAQRVELAEQREQDAAEAAAQQGAEAQLQAGGSERAQAPEDFARRFQRSYEQRARTVHRVQTQLDASKTAAELSREHRLDPQGFAEAWNSYQQGQIQAILDEDPERAVELELELNETGLNQQIRLEEQAFSREQAEQLSALNESAQELMASQADHLLETGDEEALADSLAQLEALYGEGVNSGLVSPAQADEALAGADVALSEEYVRGAFNNAIDQGDTGGARGILEGLRAGRWFDNNRKARALAGELSQSLKGSSESVPVLMDQLRRQENAIRQGVDVPLSEVNQLAERIALQGTPSQASDALALAGSATVNANLLPRLREASAGEIMQFREAVEGVSSELPPDRFNELLSTIDEEMELIQDSLATGDLTAVGGEQNWRTQTTEENLEVRNRAARRLGLDPKAVPAWQRSEIQRMTEFYEGRVERGDIGEAMEAVNSFLAPAADQPWQQVDLALRAGDFSGDFATTALYSALGSPSDGLHLQRLAGAGREADPQAVGIDTADMNSWLESSDVRSAVSTLALGNPDMVTAANAMFRDAYLGAAAEGRARGETDASSYAEREMQRLLAPLEDTTEFANGFKLPNRYLSGHPQGRRAVRRRINEVLQSPERLGLAPNEEENWRYFAPRPLGEETIGFVDTRTNRWAVNPETGEPLMLYPPEIVESSDIDMDAVGFWEGVQADVERGQQQNRVVQTARAVNQAVEATGAPGRLVEDLAMAAQATPPHERPGNRYATLGMLPFDVEDRVDMGAVEQAWNQGPGAPTRRNPSGRPMPDVGSEELAPFLLAEYSRELAERYSEWGEDAPELAAAAYWMGEDELDAILEDHGETWKRHLPGDVQKFLGRRRQRHEDREPAEIGPRAF